MTRDDDFRVRPGRIGSQRGQRARPFIAQALAAAEKVEVDQGAKVGPGVAAREVLRDTPTDTLIWTDIFDLAPLPSFTQGRVILLGNAAHAVTSDLGQAGLAIEDATVPAALLARQPLDRA